jgi:hypothetical protein
MYQRVTPAKTSRAFLKLANENEYFWENAVCQANNLGIITPLRGNISSLGFFIDKILHGATCFKILTVRKFSSAITYCSHTDIEAIGKAKAYIGSGDAFPCSVSL